MLAETFKEEQPKGAKLEPPGIFPRQLSRLYATGNMLGNPPSVVTKLAFRDIKISRNLRENSEFVHRLKHAGSLLGVLRRGHELCSANGNEGYKQ